VLVVDDNPGTRQLLQRYAASSRFQIIATDDVRQVISLAQEYQVQAIVLDVMMPEVDGWDLLSQIRHHPATQHTPIAICTILPQEQLSHLLGADAFIQKPVQQRTFLEVLDRLTASTEVVSA